MAAIAAYGLIVATGVEDALHSSEVEKMKLQPLAAFAAYG